MAWNEMHKDNETRLDQPLRLEDLLKVFFFGTPQQQITITNTMTMTISERKKKKLQQF